MITTTVYKYTFTGVVEPWGQGWYDANAIGVVSLKDPYFYLKDGFTVAASQLTILQFQFPQLQTLQKKNGSNHR